MPLIKEAWEDELYKYLGGIIKNHSGEPIEIGGMPDHVHLHARLDLKETFPDLMRGLKASSSRWVRTNFDPKFSWQRRYAAFTVSESASNSVRNYIRAQKEHHQSQPFEYEYRSLLLKHNVPFDEKYLWG
jgi:REP element-mobilizing transposase RayT